MEYRQLEYFSKICQYDSFSAAARELYISEQALSKMITSMEKELGFSLFSRGSHGLEITSGGKIILQHAEEMVDKMADLKIAAQDILEDHQSQRIVIGFYEGFLGGENSLFPVSRLAEWQKNVSGINISIFEGPNEQILSRTRKGVVDLGVFVGQTPTSLYSTQLAQIQLCAVVSKNHPLSKKESITWSDLNDVPLIHIRGKNTMHDDIVRICKKQNCFPHFAHVTVTPKVALEFVYQDWGLLLLNSLSRGMVDETRAAVIPFNQGNELVNPRISVIWSNDLELSKNHKTVIEMLKANFNPSM